MLEVIIMHSTWLRGKMTRGRLGEETVKSSVAGLVVVVESTMVVVNTTLGRLGEKIM